MPLRWLVQAHACEPKMSDQSGFPKARRPLLISLGVFIALGLVIAFISVSTANGSNTAEATHGISGQSTAKSVPSSSSTASSGALLGPAKSASPSPVPVSSQIGMTPSPVPSNDAVLAKENQKQLAAVGFKEVSTLSADLSAKVTALSAVQGISEGAGQIAGPAVQVTIEISNESSDAVSLANVSVTSNYGTAKTPATALSGPGASQFPASLAGKSNAKAVFVFAVPTNQRGALQIFLNVAASSPVAVFEGTAP